MDGLASVESVDLVFEILVLEFQEMDLSPQVEDNLLLSIHLYHRLVLDVHCASCIIQSAYRFFGPLLGRANTSDHERF